VHEKCGWTTSETPWASHQHGRLNQDDTFLDESSSHQGSECSSSSDWDVVGEGCYSVKFWGESASCEPLLPKTHANITRHHQQIPGEQLAQTALPLPRGPDSLAAAQDEDQRRPEACVRISCWEAKDRECLPVRNDVAWHLHERELVLKLGASQHTRGSTTKQIRKLSRRCRRWSVAQFDNGEPIYRFGDGGGRPPDHSTLYQLVQALDRPEISKYANHAAQE
jgi:hypothetical protein